MLNWITKRKRVYARGWGSSEEITIIESTIASYWKSLNCEVRDTSGMSASSFHYHLWYLFLSCASTWVVQNSHSHQDFKQEGCSHVHTCLPLALGDPGPNRVTPKHSQNKSGMFRNMILRNEGKENTTYSPKKNSFISWFHTKLQHFRNSQRGLFFF